MTGPCSRRESRFRSAAALTVRSYGLESGGVRAIVYTGAGGREVMRLEERPDPVPGTEELLVAARFAGINSADLAQRAGAYPAPPGAPQDVPGLEVAGTVVAVGSAGVQVGLVAGARRVLAAARTAHDRLADLGVEPVAPDDATRRAQELG